MPQSQVPLTPAWVCKTPLFSCGSVTAPSQCVQVIIYCLTLLLNHLNFYRNSAIKNHLLSMCGDRTNTIQSYFSHRTLTQVYADFPGCCHSGCRAVQKHYPNATDRSCAEFTAQSLTAFKNSQHSFVSLLFFLLLLLGLLCSSPLLSQSVFTLPPHHPQLSQ